MSNNFFTAITRFYLYVAIRSLFRKCGVRSDIFERNMKFPNIMSISDFIGKHHTFSHNTEQKSRSFSKNTNFVRFLKISHNFRSRLSDVSENSLILSLKSDIGSTNQTICVRSRIFQSAQRIFKRNRNFRRY